MNKKNIILAVFVFCVFKVGFGQEVTPTFVVPLKFENVIVYPSSALIKKTAIATFAVGENFLVFENMPSTIIPGSIRVYSSDPSVEFYKISSDLKATEELNPIEFQNKINRRDAIQIQLRNLDDQKAITNNFLNLIRKINLNNQNHSGAIGNKSNYKNWEPIINFVSDISALYLKEILAIDEKSKTLKEELKVLESDISALQNGQLSAIINIKVSARSKLKKEIEVKVEYLVDNISWYVKNRYHVDNQSKKFQLDEIAMLAQNSGEDWPACDLQFSTKSPADSLELPVLSINKLEDDNQSQPIEKADLETAILKQKKYQLPDDLPPLKEVVVSSYILRQFKTQQDFTRVFQFPRTRPTFLSYDNGSILDVELNESNHQPSNQEQSIENKKLAITVSSRNTESALDENSYWLAKQQAQNGTWPHPSNIAQATINSTCWALLSFLGSGHTDRAGKYKQNVKKALDYLIQNPPETDRIFENSLYVMVLSEASGMGCGDENTKQMATRSVKKLENLILDQPSKLQKDVSYNLHPEGIASLTFVVMALKSAMLADIETNKKVFPKLKKICLLYASPKNSSEICAGILLCLLYLGYERSDPVLSALSDKIIANLPRNLDAGFNELYLYWGALGIFQLGGQPWTKWNGVINPFVMNRFITKGPDKGSVNPDGKYGINGAGGPSGFSQVDTTAMFTMITEIYYRYASVMKDDSSGYRIVNATPDEYATLNEQMPLQFKAKYSFAIQSRKSFLPIILTETNSNGLITTELSPLISSKAYDVLYFKNPLNHPILSGETEVIVNGKLIGSYISPRFSEEESISIPLGINDGVKLTKTVDQQNDIDRKNKQVNLKVTYDIENFNNYELNIKLIERIPYSRSNDISVKNISNSKNSTFDEIDNSIIWRYNLEANKKESNTFSYEVVYPIKSSLTGGSR